MGVDSEEEGNDLFSRQRRGKKSGSRKRQRRKSSPEPDDDNEAEQLLPPPKMNKEEDKGGLRAWEREQFAVSGSGKTEKRPGAATAERIDVGGTSKATAKPFGPLSAPTNIRTSVRMDYQPDVCKDFKETGYCGFGDSCKFLHDRSDYKSGWQLERDWATKQKERRERIMRGEDPDAEPEKTADANVDDDGLPFACFICRKAFVMPVETLCKHYFCEDCALNRLKTDSTCAICGAQTRGVFNTAVKLEAQLRAASQKK